MKAINGKIDEFGNAYVDIDKVSKMLTVLSKETWIAAKGTDEGWKEWWSKRNNLNLNSEILS